MVHCRVDICIRTYIHPIIPFHQITSRQVKKAFLRGSASVNSSRCDFIFFFLPHLLFQGRQSQFDKSRLPSTGRYLCRGTAADVDGRQVFFAAPTDVGFPPPPLKKKGGRRAKRFSINQTRRRGAQQMARVNTPMLRRPRKKSRSCLEATEGLDNKINK